MSASSQLIEYSQIFIVLRWKLEHFANRAKGQSSRHEFKCAKDSILMPESQWTQATITQNINKTGVRKNTIHFSLHALHAKIYVCHLRKPLHSWSQTLCPSIPPPPPPRVVRRDRRFRVCPVRAYQHCACLTQLTVGRM